MVWRPAPPTRAVCTSHETICRRLRIQYASLHMCGSKPVLNYVFFTAVKPANNILFCIELIQRPESSLRRHKLGLTDQSILSNDDKTRFTCVHRLMTTGHSQNICRKVARWCSVTYMAVQIWLQFHFKSFVRSYVCSMNDFEVNKTMSQIFRCRLRLDHTLSQSTDQLKSDNSLFQIVLIEEVL